MGLVKKNLVVIPSVQPTQQWPTKSTSDFSYAPETKVSSSDQVLKRVEKALAKSSGFAKRVEVETELEEEKEGMAVFKKARLAWWTDENASPKLGTSSSPSQPAAEVLNFNIIQNEFSP